MANQYGTKAWKKWAKGNLEIAIALLKTPTAKWDDNMTYAERASKTIEVVFKELQVK